MNIEPTGYNAAYILQPALRRIAGRRWWQFWKPKWEPNPHVGLWVSSDATDGEWLPMGKQEKG